MSPYHFEHDFVLLGNNQINCHFVSEWQTIFSFILDFYLQVRKGLPQNPGVNSRPMILRRGYLVLLEPKLTIVRSFTCNHRYCRGDFSGSSVRERGLLPGDVWCVRQLICLHLLVHLCWPLFFPRSISRGELWIPDKLK